MAKASAVNTPANGKQKEEKAKPKEKKEPDKKVEEKKGKKQNSGMKNVLLVAIPVLLILAVFFLIVLPVLSVPFSTFKSNFLSAQRVAIFAVYTNDNDSGAVLQCATDAVQIAAHARNATTIDFYVLNATSCTYPIGGLGHSVSLGTNTIAGCLNMAASETSIFLNYSSSNYTTVTPYKLYVHGNTQYMTSCPIAVDLS